MAIVHRNYLLHEVQQCNQRGKFTFATLLVRGDQLRVLAHTCMGKRITSTIIISTRVKVKINTKRPT